MSSVIAIVKTVIGQVEVVSPGGGRHLVIEGDRIYRGEEVVTGLSGAVTLEVGKHEYVDLGRSSQWKDTERASPQSDLLHQMPNLESLHSWVMAGTDPTSTMPMSSSGLSIQTTAGGGSHTFVLLKETAGRVTPNVGYATTDLERASQSDEERTPGIFKDRAAEPVFDQSSPRNENLNITTEEDTPFDGVFSAQDPGGEPLTYIVDQPPSNGQLSLTTDGTWIYIPVANYNGSDSFTVVVTDAHGASSILTVHIGITPVNDAPLAQPDNATTREDTSVRIDVLANDTDPEGDVLSVTAANAGNGTVTINPDGTLDYTPAVNFSGTDTITYSITDGQGGTASSTVTVVVEAVADRPDLDFDDHTRPPTATGLTVETWTGLPLGTSGDGAAPDTLQSTIDAAGPPMSSRSTDLVFDPTVPVDTATKVSGLIFLEGGHTYTFGGQGDDSIRLIIGGAKVAEATWLENTGYFSGTFMPTESGYYTLELYQHNQRVDGSYLLVMADNGINAHIVGTSNTRIYHNIQELTDGGERLSELVGHQGLGYYKAFGRNEGNEDTAIPLSVINASLTDTDGSETLSLRIGHIPDGAMLSDGTHSFTAAANHNSVDVSQWDLGKLGFTPPANASGTFILEVSATATEASNQDSSTRTSDLVVKVHAVNDAPTISPLQTASTPMDTPFNGQIQANDLDHDVLSYTMKNGGGPSHGLVVIGDDGHYSYTPNSTYTGIDSFTLVVNDGNGGTAEQLISIDVAPSMTTNQSRIGDDSLLIGDQGHGAMFATSNDDPQPVSESNDSLIGTIGDDIFLWETGNASVAWQASDTGNAIVDFKAADLSDFLLSPAHDEIIGYLSVVPTTSVLQASNSGQMNASLSSYGVTPSEIVNVLVAGADPMIRTEPY